MPDPFVSVIMPVRNEAGLIEKSLGAVLAQDYPAERLEVIVVDGASNDGTSDVGRRLASEVEMVPVRVLSNQQQIVPVSLNKALDVARGEVVVRVDGHCVISRDYVSRCVQILAATEAACVGGVMTTTGETPVAKAIACAQSSRFGVGGVAFRTGRSEAGPVDTVPFGAYRRSVFDDVGKFDEELVRNQDDEFNYRVNRAGGVVWLDPAIRSTYYSRSSLRSLWKQYFEYGFYKVRVIQKGGVVSIRHFVPAVFVAALTISLLTAGITREPLWLLAVAGPYLAANTAASLRSARRDLSVLPPLPVAFATIHLAYGWGFIWGLWRWRRTFGNRSSRKLGKTFS